MIRALIITVFWSSLAFAQSGGTGVFSFLDRSIFAGSSALGNTSYINPGPVGAFAVQNPLLLNDSTLFQLEMSAAALGEGIQLLQGSYGFKIKGHPVIAAAQTIQYGEFTATDVWGNNLGIFYAGDIALSLGTPLAEWRNWRFGMTGKLVNGTYESYQSWALAMDLQAMTRLENGVDVAVLLKNTGRQLSTFAGTREALPVNLLVAFGQKLEHAPFRWALVADQLNRPNLGYDDPNLVTVDPVTGQTTQGTQSLLNLGLRHISGSLEFLPTQRLHIMAGYSFRRQFEMALADRRTSGGFTLGASVYFSKFQLHFANELRSVAGRMNTLSLNLNL
ncbi:MAG: type IX secretion system protein PorQ [Schleiferiaceae bacterium]|nr:type IX secretion system protein PorQ [Schleiferiaceae bacterium]